MQSTSTRSRSSELEALGGVEARVVQQRGGAADPRRDEDVARRLRPAARGRAPDEVAGARVEPVLGLHALAGQVALGVEDRLRLAGRAARERDQARVVRRRARRPAAGSAAKSASSGIVSDRGRPGRAAAARRGCARRRRRASGCVASRRSRRSLARSCSVHGSTTAPRRKQATIVSTHSGRLPISVMTTSPRPTPRAASVAASRAARSATSPNVHSRRVAVAGELDEREPVRVGGVDDVVRRSSSRRDV